MALCIQNESFWDVSRVFVLDSRFKFGDRPQVTKFVYLPEEEMLILGAGRETPSHKALMSAYRSKEFTDTSHWVRAIFLRDKKIIYFRQGVLNPDWYGQTADMLKNCGMAATYSTLWGPRAKSELKEHLSGFP